MIPLSLLHGFTGSPESWSEVARALEPSTRVVAPPLVGHGAADDAAVVDFESEVDRIAAYLRSRAGRWCLAGYSLGGRLALGLLVRHPSLFAGAVLVGAQPGLETEAERAERRASDERLCRKLEAEGLEAFVDSWQATPLFASQAGLPPSVLDAQRTARLHHSAAGLVRSLRTTGLAAMPSYWEQLPRLGMPVWLVAGALDTKFTEIARRMAARMPRATLEIVEDAGHNVVLERPGALIAILERALEVAG